MCRGSQNIGRTLIRYDAFGLRRTKLASGSATVYHYDGAGHLLAETDDSGALQRLYVWAGDTPVAQQAGSVRTHLHVDHLDTPRLGTGSSGALVWRWRSDGFGSAMPEEDVDGDSNFVAVNLRFPGQLYDVETGLHYNHFRYYEPTNGRYLSADPIGVSGGTNVYLYASNDPVNRIDVLGLSPKPSRGVWTGAVGRRYSQTAFPMPEINEENCDTARNVYDERSRFRDRMYENWLYGKTPPSGLSGDGTGGGIDKSLRAWIEPTGDPFRDWNRAEHESGHLAAAYARRLTDDKWLNEMAETHWGDLPRIGEFIKECEKCGFY